MKEDEDRLMEGLWMLYQAEGAPRNISIEKFCMNNDVNYNEFYKWYKSMHHGVYELQIDGSPDNVKATTLSAIPSKEYLVNPHAESTHEVYTSDGKHVFMSEDAYELYEHQLDLNSKMHQRIHAIEFKDKMKSFGYIELLVRFPDGTQIMGNVKDVPHAMAWFKRVEDSLC